MVGFHSGQPQGITLSRHKNIVVGCIRGFRFLKNENLESFMVALSRYSFSSKNFSLEQTNNGSRQHLSTSAVNLTSVSIKGKHNA